MATRAKELSDLGNLKLDVTANGIDVVGVTSVFKSESYNILNLQTDTDDSGTNDDGIFKITNGSAGTTKAEFRWDESEDLVHVSYGDHGRHISIGSDGKVGIATGSTAPSQTLDVNGTAIAEQYLLDAIDKDISDTAVDVFIYDTSKDSDGGAWRKRTQHTSWYNETLNTATRGSRKEFPAVAVIVLEAGGPTEGTSVDFTIYDGDEPDLPLWMQYRFIIGSGSNTGIAAHNGIITFGCTDNGVLISDFVKDRMRLHNHVHRHTYGSIAPGRLGRSTVADVLEASVTGYSIVSQVVNDVAMTVLPNAPIDSATGLPVPTIVVATDGGVSVIKDSGTVVDGSDTAAYTSIDISEDYRLISGRNSTQARFFISAPLDTLTSDGWHQYGFAYQVQTSGYPSVLSGDGTNKISRGKDSYVRGGTKALTLWNIKESEATTAEDFQTPSLNCYIASDYNTGWMHGDIKLATLADTRTTSLSGTNRCAADNFSSGWSVSSGSNLSISNNQLAVVDTSNTGSSFCDQTITTIVGQEYVIDVTATGTSGTGIGLYVTGYGGPVLGYQWEPTYSFTATTTSTVVRLYRFEGHTGSGTITSVIIKEAASDRSVNGNGVSAFGTVTKSAVATGADLVGYSGFSSSNYLQHTVSTNYGSPAVVSFMGWQKVSSIAGYQYMASLIDGTSGNMFGMSVNQTGVTNEGKPYFYDSVNSSLVATTRVDDGTWHFMVGVLDGTSKKLYIDGKLNVSATVTALAMTNVTNTNVGFYAASIAGSVQYPHLGSIALIRTSATAPTAEQIKKIYNDEKHLFQTNAKATLYGTSDAVTALAYDDDTELLHVGTSAGRSVFQGLRRVDNTTDAVGAAISASNGLVAED